MLKRGTILLLVSAIALLGGVILLEGNRSLQDGDETTQATDAVLRSDGEQMLPFAEEAVESLEVERAAETLAFEKTDEDTWRMVEPDQALAEPGVIAFLLNQITNPSAHTLTVEPDSLVEFGLDSPIATVSLIAEGESYQLAVGGKDFTGDQIYAQVIEPASSDAEPAETVKIHLVSGGLDNAVNRPTSEWLSVTRLETLDPEALNSEDREPESQAPQNPDN